MLLVVDGPAWGWPARQLAQWLAAGRGSVQQWHADPPRARQRLAHRRCRAYVVEQVLALTGRGADAHLYLSPATAGIGEATLLAQLPSGATGRARSRGPLP